MDLPTSTAVEVTGLDEFATQLAKHHPSSIGYIAVTLERPRGAHEPLGRRNYTRSDMAAYLPEDASPEEQEDEDPAWGWNSDDEEDPDEPEAEPNDDAGTKVGEREQEEALTLTLAAVKWIVELAEERAADMPQKIQVKVWSPKGSKLRYSKRLSFTRAEPDEPQEAPEERPASIPNRLADTSDADKTEPETWRRMNASLRRFLDTAISSMESMGALQADQGRMTRISHAADLRTLRETFESYRRMTRDDLATMREANKTIVESLRGVIAQQAEQLREAHQRIDTLIGDSLGFKLDLADLGMGQTRSAEDRKVVADLGKNFMDQAGNLAQLWLASKTGVFFDPELVELLKVVQEDDKLRAALKNPKLLALLKNPQLREVFIGAINEAAEALFSATGDAAPTTDSTPT